MTAIWVYEIVSSFLRDPCRQAMNEHREEKSRKILFINAMSPNTEIFGRISKISTG